MQISDALLIIILIFLPVLYFKLDRLEGLLLGHEPIDRPSILPDLKKVFKSSEKRKIKVNDDANAFLKEKEHEQT